MKDFILNSIKLEKKKTSLLFWVFVQTAITINCNITSNISSMASMNTLINAKYPKSLVYICCDLLPRRLFLTKEMPNFKSWTRAMHCVLILVWNTFQSLERLIVIFPHYVPRDIVTGLFIRLYIYSWASFLLTVPSAIYNTMLNLSKYEIIS